jgi:hypothetical protein
MCKNFQHKILFYSEQHFFSFKGFITVSSGDHVHNVGHGAVVVLGVVEDRETPDVDDQVDEEKECKKVNLK